MPRSTTALALIRNGSFIDTPIYRSLPNAFVKILPYTSKRGKCILGVNKDDNFENMFRRSYRAVRS